MGAITGGFPFLRLGAPFLWETVRLVLHALIAG